MQFPISHKQGKSQFIDHYFKENAWPEAERLSNLKERISSWANFSHSISLQSGSSGTINSWNGWHWIQLYIHYDSYACPLFPFTFCPGALKIEMHSNPVGGNFLVWIFNDNILQGDGTCHSWWSGLAKGQFKKLQMKSTKCQCCSADQATKHIKDTIIKQT